MKWRHTKQCISTVEKKNEMGANTYFHKNEEHPSDFDLPNCDSDIDVQTVDSE